MHLLSAIARSNFNDVKQIIDLMIMTDDIDELNMAIKSDPPMTLYEVAVEQDKEVATESSRAIVNYMREKGALTYQELLKINPVPGIPLAKKGENRIERNKGIASLTRRSVVPIGPIGGKRSRYSRIDSYKRRTRRRLRNRN